MNLQENSLYKDQAGLTALLSDKTKVADIFYINFLGFAGLLKIKDAPAIGVYAKNMGKVQLTGIDDTNNDWSLGIKLAVDAGVVNRVAASMATRFLALIKSGKIKSADIKDEPIRDIIRACRIANAKPSARVYKVVRDFLDDKITLDQLAGKYWRITAMPEYKELAEEFRDIAVRGTYSADLTRLAAATTAPSAPVSTTQAVSTLAKSRGSLPAAGAAKGSDTDYMAALLHVFKLKGGIHSYLERFGFKDHFDVDRFKKAVVSPAFHVPHGYHVPWEQHPFVQWIRKKDSDAASQVVKILYDKEKGAVVASPVTVAAISDAPKPAAVVSVTATPIIDHATVERIVDAASPHELHERAKEANWGEGRELIKFIQANKAKILPIYKTLDAKKVLAGKDAQSSFSTQLGPISEVLRQSLFPDAEINTPIFNSILKLIAKKDLPKVFGVLDDPTFRYFASNNGSVLSKGLEGVWSQSELIQIFAADLSKYYEDHRRLAQAMLPIQFPEPNILHLVWRLVAYSDVRQRTIEDFLKANSIAYQRMGVTMTIDPDLSSKVDATTLSLFKDVIRIARDASALEGRIVYEKVDNRSMFDAAMDHQKKSQNLNARARASLDGTRLIFETLVKAWQGETNLDKYFLDFEDRCSLSIGVLYGFEVDKHSLAPAVRAWFFSKLASTVDIKWPDLPDRAAYGSRGAFPHLAQYIEMLQRQSNFDAFRRVFPYWISFAFGNEELGNWIDQIVADPVLKDALAERIKRWEPTSYGLVQVCNEQFIEEFFAAATKKAAIEGASILVNKHGKFDEGIKAIRWALKFFESSIQGAAEALTSSSRSFLETAWFVRPESKDYEKAKATLTADLRASVATIIGIRKRVIETINPEILEFVSSHIRSSDMEFHDAIRAASVINKEDGSALLHRILSKISTQEIQDQFKTYGGQSDINYFVGKINEGDYTDDLKKFAAQKIAPALEVLNVHDVKEKASRDKINQNFATLLVDVHAVDKAFANEIFADLPRTTRSFMVKERGEQSYMESIRDELYKHPIKPIIDLDHDRIKQILSFNNLPIKLPTSASKVKKIEDIDELVKAANTVIGDLKIEEVDMQPEELDSEILRVNKRRNSNHGKVGMKILKVFNVNFPGEKERIDEFGKQHPKDGRMNSVFHGSGSVAASLILRNGFRIIPATDISAVGRALGNGIYFSNISNKALQYVGDHGGDITRRIGTRGYLFEMEAELGLAPVNYKYAGPDKPAGTNGFVFKSPEWAVFDPANQLRIFRAYYVEIAPMTEINQIAAKYNDYIKESETFDSFETFLLEASNQEKNISRFWFRDGTIPKSKTEAVSVDDYKPRSNVFLEPSWDGGVNVYVSHSVDKEEVSLSIPDTDNWLLNTSDQVDLFFDLI